MYFVAEWTTRSAPRAIGRCRAGLHTQLSMARMAPACRAIDASPAMSTISQTGFEGVSAKSSFVRGRRAARQASRSFASTQVV
jgi:hypothetical protein